MGSRELGGTFLTPTVPVVVSGTFGRILEVKGSTSTLPSPRHAAERGQAARGEQGTETAIWALPSASCAFRRL